MNLSASWSFCIVPLTTRLPACNAHRIHRAQEQGKVRTNANIIGSRLEHEIGRPAHAWRIS